MRANNSRQWGRLHGNDFDMGLENLVGIWQMEDEEGHFRMRKQQKQMLREAKAREVGGARE